MNKLDKPVQMQKPRRQWWVRWLKRIAAALLITAIAFAGWLGWRHYQATKKLDELLTELDRTEPCWRMSEIEEALEDIPSEANSAHVVVAAARNLPQSWPLEDLYENDFWVQPSNEMLSDEDFVVLSDKLKSVRTTLEIADKLADMPRGRHRSLYSRNSVFPAFATDQLRSRRIVTWLLYESVWRSQLGESKKALTACRAALNAARSLGDEPSQLSQLIRHAAVGDVCWAVERTLGQGQPPPEEMAALQKLIEMEDAFPALLTAARGRRASGHRVFEAIERGKISREELSSRRMGWLEKNAPSLWYMDARKDHALFLSLMTRRIKDAQRPMHEQVALDKEFEKEFLLLPKKAFITHWLLSTKSRVSETFRRKHALIRCTIVSLAAERYRRDKKAWPERIGVLCPQYLAVVPVDPFDGQALRYRRVEDGILIYSVGADIADDGGHLDPEHRDVPGADLGSRLWDADKRRQPPQPKPDPAPNPG